MKKSMLMLVALFMLGACSTKDDSTVDSDWKAAVGGKYVYGISAEDTSLTDLTGTDDEPGDYLFYFSPDASVIYPVVEITADDDSEEWDVDYDSPINIKSSTATGAIYEDADDDGYITVTFTGLNNGGGAYEMDSDFFGDDKGTFTLLTSLPLGAAIGSTYVNAKGDVSYFFGGKDTLVITSNSMVSRGTYEITKLSDYTKVQYADGTEIKSFDGYEFFTFKVTDGWGVTDTTTAVVKVDNKTTMYMFYAGLSFDKTTITVASDSLDTKDANEVYTRK